MDKILDPAESLYGMWVLIEAIEKADHHLLHFFRLQDHAGSPLG